MDLQIAPSAFMPEVVIRWLWIPVSPRCSPSVGLSRGLARVVCFAQCFRGANVD